MSSYQRWYDKDPALAKALDQLRHTTDHQQAQIALNLIKIIVEHQIEAETRTSIDEMDSLFPRHPNDVIPLAQRRWYDVNKALSSAMQLLADSPDDLRQRMLPAIVGLIEQTLNTSDEEAL